MSSENQGTSSTTPQQGEGNTNSNSNTQQTTPESSNAPASNRNSNSNNKNRSTAASHSTTSFKGKTPDVGAIIGTKGESLSNKDTYRNFIEQLRGYVKIHIKPGGNDLVHILDHLTEIDTSNWEPADPTQDKATNIVKMEKWKMAMKRYHERLQCLEDNTSQLYDIIYGQCTRQLQTDLKALPSFEEMQSSSDAAQLLKHIKLLSSGVEQKTQDPYEAMFFLQRNFFNMRQGEREMCDTYVTKFRDYIQTLEIAGADIFYHPSLHVVELRTLLEDSGRTIDEATDAERTQAKHIAIERYKSICFLENSDSRRYLPLLTNLRNDVITGNNKFPSTVTRAYELISK